ncbi:Protein of unknown function [Bacillus mycoides]|nr:Protein of unknown function [Bacillus mycoides]
MSVLMKVKK